MREGAFEMCYLLLRRIDEENRLTLLPAKLEDAMRHVSHPRVVVLEAEAVSAPEKPLAPPRRFEPKAVAHGHPNRAGDAVRHELELDLRLPLGHNLLRAGADGRF